MGSLGGIGTLVAVWVGGRLVASGTITLGEFVAFSGYLGLLIWPTVAMGWVINSFQRGLVGMRRLQEILDLPGEFEASDADGRITKLTGDIEIRQLTLSHQKGDPRALRNLSLRVQPGETVALVGPVGAGKSTIANILPRLIKVPDGTVFVDGYDINHIPLQVLRSAIAYAPQEAFLFSRSIRENIAFGLDRPRPGQVEEASHLAGLGRDLESFPQGLETPVGEGGFTLSGGQRQRTALARAAVLGPRILILDDALSSVDAETEREILGRLSVLLRDKTAILISHRLAAVANADRIVVMDNGQVVEEGTHEELLAREGFYARLFRQQTLEREIETQA